jgi:ABC-type transporter Mla MlaB component
VATAVKQIGRVRLGDHLCLPFGTDEEQRQVVAPFVVDGLARGEKVVYLSDGTAPEALTVWLRAFGVDARPAWARGQLDIRPAEAAYAPTGRFCPGAMVDFVGREVATAQQGGYRGLRLAGEMGWALRAAPGSGGLPEYERQVQPLFDGRGVAALCQYDRRLFGDEAVAGFAACHRMTAEPNPLYDDPALRITPTYRPRGMRVVGTVDRTTCDGLAAALRRWAASEPGDIHLDMSGLQFIDIAGLRALVNVARDLERRTLHLDNLAPMLSTVVGLAGWADTPGLALPPGVGRA